MAEIGLVDTIQKKGAFLQSAAQAFRSDLVTRIFDALRIVSASFSTSHPST